VPQVPTSPERKHHEDDEWQVPPHDVEEDADDGRRRDGDGNLDTHASVVSFRFQLYWAAIAESVSHLFMLPC